MIDNNWNAEERRKQERFSLESHPRVFIQGNDSFIGYIVDISIGGMMLRTETPLPSGQTFKFCVEIYLTGNKSNKVTDTVSDTISLEAISVWDKPDAAPGFFNTGFRFVNLSTASLMGIQTLIDDLTVS